MSFIRSDYVFTPTAISNCALWLDASQETGGNGTSLSTITDRSNSGNSVTASGTISVASSFLGGLTVYNFSNSRAYTNNFPWQTSFTQIVLVKCASGSWLSSLWNGGYLAYVYSGNWNLEYISGFYANDSSIGQGTSVFSSTPGGTTAWAIFSLGYQSGATSVSNYSLNGTVRTSQTGSAYSGTLPTTAQLWLNGNGNGSFDTVYVAEFLHYNSVLSSTQVQQVEGYLAQKWGLTSSLAAGHPGRTTTIYKADYRKVNIMGTLPYYATFSPRQIAGCSLWLDAADSSTITGTSSVSAWTDKSGKGNNAVFTGTNPSYTAANKYVETSNLNQEFSVPSTIFNTVGGSLFIVYADKQQNTSYGMLYANSGGYSPYYFDQCLYRPDGYSYALGGVDVPSSQFKTAMNTTNKLIYSINYVYNTVNYNVTVNGTVYPFTSIIGTAVVVPSGSLVFSGGWGGAANIKFNEIIFFNSILSTAQVQQVESYLAQKWGLTASLPGDHSHFTKQAGALTKVSNTISKFVPLPFSLAKTVGLPVMSHLPMLINSTDIGGTPQTVTTNGTVTYTTIAGKQCAYFSNSLSNYLSLPYINQTQLTLCFWLYCIDTGYYTAVSINNGLLSPNLQVDINPSTNNTTIYTMMPNYWTNTPTGNYGGPGQWAHFAITINYATFFEQIYINGTSVATSTGTGSPSLAVNQFWLGRSGDNGRAYYGYLRQFCFFPTVLTQAQIQAVKTYTT